MVLFNEVKASNPRLFYDGICRGKISYNEISGVLATGSPVTNAFVEGFFGFPRPQIDASFDPVTTSVIGPSGYPKPWRSLSQFNQDVSYGSLIGPYARVLKLPNSMENTCVEGKNPKKCGESGSKSAGVWGRIGIGDGQYLFFRPQDWYNQNEGTFNTAYFNAEYGTDWLTWKQWWDSTSKKTITVKWDNQIVEAEVAHDSPSVSSPNYYAGPNLSTFANSSLQLLSVMVGVAVATRWL